MKKFLIKFCILFAIIDGFLLYYAIAVYPNISGDMGALYKYPFGKAYNDSIKNVHKLEGRYVYDIQNLDSIPSGSILTIGDSYSQQDSLGYQQFLGDIIDKYIYNISVENTRTNHPEKSFVRLVNNGLIDSSQIVIVESVERGFIGRLNQLDLHDTTRVKLHVSTNEKYFPRRVDYVEEAMQKLRLLFGYKRPIANYNLTKPLFSHPKFANNIFIYHSPYIGDSELLFSNDSAEIKQAYENLEKLYNFAVEHKIKMIYLIVPDKYDVYFPYILDAPRSNITLDMCPNRDYIINPRDELRRAISEGQKDVWYLNDTHYSPVAAKIVARKIAICLDNIKK